MLRNLGLIAAISTTLTLSITEVARSQTTLPNASKPEQPLCYIQTADGKLLDLQSLCAQSVPANTDANQSNSNQSDSNQPNRHHHYAEFRNRELRGEYLYIGHLE